MTPIVRDLDTAPFFDAAAEERLLVRRCEQGHLLPVAPFTLAYAGRSLRCPDCGSSEVGWAEASGAATLVTWTVVHPKHGDPVVAGIVELAEGPWMYASIAVAPDAPLSAGQPLEVAFEHPDEGEATPVFRPALEAAR